MSDLIAAIPRGDYPAYAAAHVRELIARYRPSVLWNDIAWPDEGKHLWPLFAEYYDAVPDGVVNDRWMPWNPLAGAIAVRRRRASVVDAGAVRQARKDAGLIPPEPPFYDVRTPGVHVVPDDPTPAVGVRAGDGPVLRVQRGVPARGLPDPADLLWSFADMVSKNGNLLLNVGPRGIDAQIPDEQRLRLQWLGEWMAANERRGPRDPPVGPARADNGRRHRGALHRRDDDGVRGPRAGRRDRRRSRISRRRRRRR